MLLRSFRGAVACSVVVPKLNTSHLESNGCGCLSIERTMVVEKSGMFIIALAYIFTEIQYCHSSGAVAQWIEWKIAIYDLSLVA